MRRLLFVLWFFIGFGVLSHSQESQIDFIQKKPVNEGYVVYFEVNNLADQEQANTILKSLLKDSRVYSGQFFKSSSGGDRFKLVIDESITASNIRSVLHEYNVDYNYSTITSSKETNFDYSSNNDISYPKENVNSKSNFPEYISTGNKREDDEKYGMRKEKWIQENPEEYEQLLKELKTN